MSELIVLAFDNPDEATRIATDFKALRQTAHLQLKDAMVVVKDAEGKVHIKDEAGHPVAWGAVIGGTLGAILFILVPVVGAVAGAALGGAIAHWMDLGVDKKFVKEVGETLKPNTSALFLLVGEGNDAAVVQALKPYKGTLLQTNVSSELESELKRVVEQQD